MRRVIKMSTLLFVLFVLNVTGSYGWNRRGHFIVAAIAYRQIESDDPARLGELMTILNSHPDSSKWSNEYEKAPSGYDVPRDAYFFMRAAAWPDDVRSPQGNPEHHPTWHYINYPLMLPATIKYNGSAIEGDIFTAIKTSFDELANSSIAPEEKARKISWLLHLIGDVHQPLHTVALTGSGFAHGDHGGNLECIRAEKGNRAVILHSYWDDLLGASPLDQVIDDAGQAWDSSSKLINQPPGGINPSQFKSQPDAPAWAKESAQLALKDAYEYRNSPVEIRKTVKKTVNGKSRDVCPVVNGGWLPLSAGYYSDATGIARRRVLTAGYRLANALEKMSLQ